MSKIYLWSETLQFNRCARNARQLGGCGGGEGEGKKRVKRAAATGANGSRELRDISLVFCQLTVLKGHRDPEEVLTTFIDLLF